MRIGQLARQANVSEQTVRYYERCGLLRRPPRESSGYRAFGEADLAQLRFIRQAKRLGFTLAQIKLVFDLREQKACPCGEVVKLGKQRLADLDTQIARLSRFRHELGLALDQWEACPEQAPPGDAICVLIEKTMKEGAYRSPKRKATHGVQTR